MRDVSVPGRPVVDPADEARHEPGPEQLWGESWYFDFCAPDGSIGGWVRLGLYPNLRGGEGVPTRRGVSWYHAFVCGPDRPTVAVIDTAAAIPPRTLELRAHELWADHIGSHPLERWQVDNEAHGVAVDDPAELYRPGGPRGDRVPMGLNLEWETDGEPYRDVHTTRYEIPCLVHGEIHLGDETIELDGYGHRDHSWGVRDWWRAGWVWTAGRLGDGTRFHGCDNRVPEPRTSAGSLQSPDGAVVPAAEPDSADGSVLADEDLGDEGFPTSASVSIAGVSMAITPLAFAPALLVGPDGRVARIPRAMCRFDAADGRSGYGWTEWHQPSTGSGDGAAS